MFVLLHPSENSRIADRSNLVRADFFMRSLFTHESFRAGGFGGRGGARPIPDQSRARAMTPPVSFWGPGSEKLY